MSKLFQLFRLFFVFITLYYLGTAKTPFGFTDGETRGLIFFYFLCCTTMFKKTTKSVTTVSDNKEPEVATPNPTRYKVNTQSNTKVANPPEESKVTQSDVPTNLDEPQKKEAVEKIKEEKTEENSVVQKETLLTTFQHKSVSPEQSKTFEDIAGYETTKQNMMFLVECMKNREELQLVGAKVPNGVIFYGPPGTGKTLLASAVAGTAGVGFLEINASAFMNTYVGTGPAAVRALYSDARAQAPCVVFIDEIDSVGGKRTAEQNPEHRLTLNALLSELDGMNSGEGVMTIAATNDLAMLDDAFVRSGRFDRKVMIPLPDESDREAILRIHGKNKRLAEDVDFAELAKNTANFSGASLATMMNEAALITIADKRKMITKKDIEKATFQMLTNGEEVAPQEGETRTLVAWHEAGHALCLKALCRISVPQTTIKGSTSGTLGVTLLSDDSKLLTRRSMKQRIKSIYAGRVAESILTGNEEDVSSGASQDINQASELIKEYHRLYRINGKNAFVNTDIVLGTSDQSVSIEELNAFATKLYQETKKYLTANQEVLTAIAEALLDKESIDDKQLSEIIDSFELKR